MCPALCALKLQKLPSTCAPWLTSSAKTAFPDSKSAQSVVSSIPNLQFATGKPFFVLSCKLDQKILIGRFAEKLDDEIRKLTMERKTLLDGESFSGDQNIENLQEMRLRQRQLAKIQEDFNMSPESDSEDDGEENNEDGSQPPADLSPV